MPSFRLLKEEGNFGVGVAAYPQGHRQTADFLEQPDQILGAVAIPRAEYLRRLAVAVGPAPG